MGIQGRGKTFPPYKNDGNLKSDAFLQSKWCSAFSVKEKKSLKDEIKWRCEISMRNKEWLGLFSFLPWNSTRELGFGWPLSTELTKHSILPGYVQCLFNWSASLRGECVLHLREVHNWGDPALSWRFHWSQQVQQEQTEPLWDQADAQIRYCLCARKKTKMHQKSTTRTLINIFLLDKEEHW